jgi:hypothetical protein
MAQGVPDAGRAAVKDLASLVPAELKNALNEVTPGRLPWDQPEATALAMSLTWKTALAVRRATSRTVDGVVLHGAPKTEKTKSILERCGITYLHTEFMVDFCAFESTSPTVLKPIVACESEAHSDHGCSYTLDAWNSGYVWDFRKLLHFKSPRLLYVARTNKCHMQFPVLEQTLRACAADYAATWDDAQLSVVLLPSGSTQLSLVRIGFAAHGDELRFCDLIPA